MIKLALLAAAVGVAATASPEGFQVGSKDAPTTLVEYGSLHCPHCAQFAEQGMPEIRKRVRAGQLRFEFRPFLIFPQDVPATLIARCVPPARRLGFVEDYYRNSAAVTQRVRAAAGELNAMREQGLPALNRKVVAVGQMKAIAARHGLSYTAVDQCVSYPGNMKRLEAAQELARKAGVNGTPTFEVNGERRVIAGVEDLRTALNR